MNYEVEVRPGPNTEFFQYYTETVEAPTSHDAVARVQRANPGCVVRTTNSWSEYSDNESESSSSSEISGGLVLIGLVVMLLIYAWKWILLIGAISLVIWFIIQFVNDN
jgi:hypothetical protein